MRLAGVRVLIWGWGRHGGGAAAAAFCARMGADVSILDRSPVSAFAVDAGIAPSHAWPWHVGDASHPAFAAAELIVASPAIPPRAWPTGHPPRTSPEALALAWHRGRRVAVTGTKGKSTTAHLTASLLGWRVAGNSFRPLLEVLAEGGQDVPLVCELSSFQLWYLAVQPPRFDVAVFTSLAVDHLDWHSDLAEYRASKLALLEWADRCVVAPGVPWSGCGLPRVGWNDASFVTPDGRDIARREDLNLPGEHNAGNAALALTAALALGADLGGLAGRLRQVKQLEHRLMTVHEADGIRYIDDSIATTPEACIAALASFSGPLAVILGGSDKGASFTGVAQAVARRGAFAFVIGSTAARLAQELSMAGVVADQCGDLGTAVDRARVVLSGGGTLLLSPACASFDQFLGFEDRGRRFAALARTP